MTAISTHDSTEMLGVSAHLLMVLLFFFEPKRP